MDATFDLRKLERRAWRSVHADGLIDLFFGWLLLTGWLRDVTGTPAASLLPFAGLLILWLGKRYVTVPRLGVVTFGAHRRARQRRLLLLTGVTVVLMAAVWVLVTAGAVEGAGRAQGVNLFVTAVILAAFVGLGWLMDLPRLFAVGLVFAGANFVRGFTDSPLVHLVAAVVVTVPGLILLATFVRRHPVAATREEGAS